jgi:hypothetical protein
MAQSADIRIWVTSSRTQSTVRYRTAGRYGSISVNTVSDLLRSQPLFTTASPEAFWLAVLAVVQADIPSH